MKILIFILKVLAIIVLSGCINQPSSGSGSTPPTQSTSRVAKVGVFCPTENDQARQFYDTAHEFEKQGKLEEAKQAYRNAIELDPEYCDAMDNLGLLLRHQGRLEEAISWYKRSIEVLPDNPVAHQDLAMAYRMQGRVDDAAAEYQQLIRIDLNNPEGYYGLGTTYLLQDKPREAISQFQKAEALYMAQASPLVTDARYSLGIAYVISIVVI